MVIVGSWTPTRNPVEIALEALVLVAVPHVRLGQSSMLLTNLRTTPIVQVVDCAEEAEIVPEIERKRKLPKNPTTSFVGVV